MSDIDRGTDESLAGQRVRLASLASCEERIGVLREQECELEVENMAAQAALHSASNRVQPKIDPVLASRLGRSLEHRRDLEESRRNTGSDHGMRKADSSRERDALQTGHAALLAWLDAAKPGKRTGTVGVAKITLLIATVATVWAAYAIHPAFLLLLIAVVGPVSFAMGRGQDAEWRRVGAKRRFETSGLADIATWDEQTVRTRIAELESLLEKSDRGDPDEDGDISGASPTDEQALAAQIAELDEQIATELAVAGLTAEDTQGETGNWLRLVARAERSRESLERIKSERKRLRDEAAVLREQLQRYLQAQGIKPTEQQDTARAIADRLDRLSGSN